MEIKVIEEAGYKSAMFGLSLNKKKDPKNMPPVANRLAFKGLGHNKFLESMKVWLYIKAPRFWWQEFDTYRLVTKNSESTMHTLLKDGNLTLDDCDEGTEQGALDIVNKIIVSGDLIKAKKNLPEGFLQGRQVCTCYKTLQNIYLQRRNHKLPHWQEYFKQLLDQVDHPEFIQQPKKDTEETQEIPWVMSYSKASSAIRLALGAVMMSELVVVIYEKGYMLVRSTGKPFKPTEEQKNAQWSVYYSKDRPKDFKGTGTEESKSVYTDCSLSMSYSEAVKSALVKPDTRHIKNNGTLKIYRVEGTDVQTDYNLYEAETGKKVCSDLEELSLFSWCVLEVRRATLTNSDTTRISGYRYPDAKAELKESEYAESTQGKDSTLIKEHSVKVQGVKVSKGSLADEDITRIRGYKYPDKSTVVGSVLEETLEIINGGRLDVYGKPENSFTTIGEFWTTYLRSKLKTDATVTPKDACILMTLLKVARESHQHKRDNLRDGAGYLGIAADLGYPKQE